MLQAHTCRKKPHLEVHGPVAFSHGAHALAAALPCVLPFAPARERVFSGISPGVLRGQGQGKPKSESHRSKSQQSLTADLALLADPCPADPGVGGLAWRATTLQFSSLQRFVKHESEPERACWPVPCTLRCPVKALHQAPTDLCSEPGRDIRVASDLDTTTNRTDLLATSATRLCRPL